MNVEIHADTHLSQQTHKKLRDEVLTGLERFATRLTRIEIHLKDVRAGQGVGSECRLEARPAHRDPEFVSHHAGDVLEALDGALEKMRHRLDHIYERLGSVRGPSASGLPT